MTAKTIILHISNAGIGLHPGHMVTADRTNIPFRHLMFRTVAPIYWEAEMIAYDAAEKRLHLRVVRYEVEQPFPRFTEQLPKKEVAALYFEKLDWEHLEPQLASYTKMHLRNVVSNLDQPVTRRLAEPPDDKTLPSASVPLTFQVPFSEARIESGAVCFERFIEQLGRDITFRIPNPFLLPEFDLIKPFFAKKLKAQHFLVKAVVHFRGGEVVSVEATSTQITAINENMLQTVRQQRIQGLVRTPKIEGPDKTLFTSEDIFDTLHDGCPGNPFRQSDRDILDFLLENKKVRNRQQLVYLAGSRHAAQQPLRFTLAPQFGFLFFMEGETHYHFAWELLNSNATYLWSFPRASWFTPERCYQNVAEQINAVRASGRSAYRRSYQAHPVGRDFDFHYIEHEHIGSALVDAFPKWRHRLEELLV